MATGWFHDEIPIIFFVAPSFGGDGGGCGGGGGGGGGVFVTIAVFWFMLAVLFGPSLRVFSHFVGAVSI